MGKPNFSDAFTRDAVAQITERGYPVAQVLPRLGVSAHSRAAIWRCLCTDIVMQKEQFDQAMSAVRGSSDLVALGKGGRGEDWFTSHQMIETRQRLQRASEMMAERKRNGVDQKGREGALDRRRIGLLHDLCCGGNDGV